MSRRFYIARHPHIVPAEITRAHAAPYDRLETATQDMGGGVVFDSAGDIIAFHERHLRWIERHGARMEHAPRTATFRTVDTALRHLYGQTVTVVGTTPRDRFDPSEVGDDIAPMLVVRFPDGTERDVFADELTEA
jgi:hypothetical protein